MNENKVPQDIIDAATHYADNHDHIHQEYKAYVQGRIDERTQKQDKQQLNTH